MPLCDPFPPTEVMTECNCVHFGLGFVKYRSNHTRGKGKQLSSMKLHVTGVVLAIFVLLGAVGQGMAGEPKRSGWYVGAGAGVNWTSEMKQAGWNLDTLC